jgi:phospholipid/cholesterol/gamma-HCH transport system substrate-binding protein
MSLRIPHPRVIAISVVTLLAVASSAVGIKSAFAEQKPTVYAQFVDASPLIVGNDVKVGGVKVGQIASIKVVDGLAKIGLKLDPEAMPVHTDAKATVRPQGLLGERFVDLDRGSAASPLLADGGSIPKSQTGRTTDLDEVLDAVDEPTGQALAAVVTSLGEGVRGRGQDVDGAVKALQPAMQDTGQVADLLNSQSAVLTHLIDNLQPLAQSLATDEGADLDRLVGSADEVLGATADSQQSLDLTLQRLPSAIHDARTTLRQLGDTADATTPTLAGMRPATDKLVAISAELRRFADAADPALAQADPLLAQAKKLIDQAAPVVASLRRAGPDLSGTARNARPIATKLMGNLRNVLDFVKYWALTTNGGDGLAHYFRAHAVVTAEPATGYVPGAGDAVKIPKIKTPKIPGLPLDGTVPDLGSATGLSSAQEDSLLDNLIGGQG